MSELQVHAYLVWTMLVLAAVTFVSLFFVTAPYGRHVRPGWGPLIPARLGWIIMESPAVLLFIGIYAMGDNAQSTVAVALLALWQFHYIGRTFIYPFRLRASGKTMPAVIAMMAFTFNCLNAYINARWISHLGEYSEDSLGNPLFITGAALFVAGWLINQHADAVLIRLRKPGETGYAIPRGGLYRWISCPNYFGEILTWCGWAIASWSLAGFAFALFTIANLLPRALANHRWYRQTFDDYPATRRALIPHIL